MQARSQKKKDILARDLKFQNISPKFKVHFPYLDLFLFLDLFLACINCAFFKALDLSFQNLAGKTERHLD